VVSVGVTPAPEFLEEHREARHDRGRKREFAQSYEKAQSEYRPVLEEFAQQEYGQTPILCYCDSRVARKDLGSARS
jgi:hypothetical protein